VTPEEACRIESLRANRLYLLDVCLFLERGDTLEAVRITDAANRIILGAQIIEALTKRLDALRNEVGDESLTGHP
jgi:hypothetical protein